MIRTDITRIQLTLDEMKRAVLEYIATLDNQYSVVTPEQVTVKASVDPRGIINIVTLMIYDNEAEKGVN